MARSAEAIVIVLDVGQSVGREISLNGETFLHNAQLCATKIIQKKIFTRSKDEIGLILLGSEDTNNPLANDENYNNIEIRHQLQCANWRMVQTISSFKKGTSVDGDWLDALIVAADFMRTASEGKKFKERKIVILTNFKSDVSDDEVNFVIEALQTEKIQVIVIGPQVYKSQTQEMELDGDLKSQDQKQGEALMAKIIDSVEGSVLCSFEDAMYSLMYFGTKKVRPTPWSTTMEIGSKVKIPITAYKKISEVQRLTANDVVIPSKLKTMSTLSSQDSVSQDPDAKSAELVNAVSQNETVSQDPDAKSPELINAALEDEDDFGDSKNLEYVAKDRIYTTIGDEATPVDINELIEGYMFGETLVPVTEDDKPELVYESGPKCLSVLGFTDKGNVPLYYFKGECHQIFPQKEENSMRAFAALIQAMHSKDMVAIVRKVYRMNSAPLIGALFPMITPELQCFILVELPFSESVKTLLFPPLVIDKNKPTEKQLNAVDQLILSMNLMELDDDNETGEGAYDPHNTPDPYEQHFHSLVAKKVLNGELYISGSDIDEAVIRLLTPKEEMLNKAKPAVEKIKELFTLTKITPKEGARNAAADIFKPDTKPLDIVDVKVPLASMDSKPTPPHIGTVRPDKDFISLLNQGVSLNEACSLLDQVIRDMVHKAFDADDFKKPLKCLLLMRKKCVDSDPTVYNDKITIFKKDLPAEKVGFWQLIVNEEAGLITTSESHLSTIHIEEAQKFLQVNDVNDVMLPTQDVDEDIDDLINQM
ncbi:X-ray repair cross-complementing protein 5 isoform X2 [Thrips palmi]|uniref:X-ray repair cross-complementing protein 5 isoform X2 n=1 Tax=Thrips palmi TaxID=161013 RepID=A0A6P8Z533_THRPL|nr:X-ray repair cross-complementing protein 5 isoform X2 [Thrips palmi]